MATDAFSFEVLRLPTIRSENSIHRAIREEATSRGATHVIISRPETLTETNGKRIAEEITLVMTVREAIGEGLGMMSLCGADLGLEGALYQQVFQVWFIKERK